MTALAQALPERTEMLRKNALVAGFTAVVLIGSAHGQSPASPDSAGDFMDVCREHGEAQLVFVGRVHPPLTFRISGEPEIEIARQNVMRVKAEVERLRASLDLKGRLERNAEFEISIIEAEAELDRRRAMYPPPLDLTLFPVQVEQRFRGVTDPMLLLRQIGPSIKLQPGELYLISGRKSDLMDLLSAFPWRPDLAGLEYVDAPSVTPVASAQQELRFLASASSGATILGRLNMHSYGDGIGSPLERVRIQVASELGVTETTTGADGSFVVTGISSGRLGIRPLLPEDLTIVNTSALTMTVRDRGCNVVYLTAAPNGRVRGKIFSATGTSPDRVELFLDGGISSAGPGPISMSVHAPRSSVRPNNDGTFEFSGVFPGSYVLYARLERIMDGKTRYSITYFPGTPDLASARPIVVGRATLHDGFDFVVTTE